ncbi:DUF3784 domain-containing protein [Dyadobacter crusticola]|uniref:DUF3784 domain-containing protein n=1 Tax=Dyadobacter crusticola TaxID=292407 RepID=UPI0004E14AA0|nr:DUF3784 domain-containing protein [Dyadobacter crusticola]
MIYVALFLSVIFASVGFIVTKNNAKYLLSGYNTMSETQRASFNIEGYLAYFKRFHIFLGLSLFLGTVLINIINSNWASIFMTTFPLVAYAYMVVRGTFYMKASSDRRLVSYVAGGILLAIAVFIGINATRDLQSSALVLGEDFIEIKGSYGVKIRKHDIRSAQLVNEVPPVSYKINGFAAGDYAKGSFKLKNGKTVRMFVNKKKPPFLVINTNDGEIYYNTDEGNLDTLAKRIQIWLSFK